MVIAERLLQVLAVELNSPQKDYIRVAQESCKRLIALLDKVAEARDPDLPIRRS